MQRSNQESSLFFLFLTLFASNDQSDAYDIVCQLNLLCPVLLRRRQETLDQLPLFIIINDA
jgi:hypothetical protein